MWTIFSYIGIKYMMKKPSTAPVIPITVLTSICFNYIKRQVTINKILYTQIPNYPISIS